MLFMRMRAREKSDVRLNILKFFGMPRSHTEADIRVFFLKPNDDLFEAAHGNRRIDIHGEILTLDKF